MNAPEQRFLTANIGDAFEGGFFAGVININGKPHALIAAPCAAGGETISQWIHDRKEVPEAGSELANWARGLQIGGFTDWFVPARDQLELLYRNLKPSKQQNFGFRGGDNPSSVPAGYPYSRELPLQTPVQAFQEGGAEAFDTDMYWTSTQHASDPEYAWCQDFDDGYQYDSRKSYEARVRAVRTIQLTA
jgi:hypothetical protein